MQRSLFARSLSADLNVTPMLDVLLVLLVIFMVLAQGWHTMDAQLPAPCELECRGDASIVLEVLPGPAYRLNRVPVSAGELSGKLRAAFAGRPNKGHPGGRSPDGPIRRRGGGDGSGARRWRESDRDPAGRYAGRQIALYNNIYYYKCRGSYFALGKSVRNGLNGLNGKGGSGTGVRSTITIHTLNQLIFIN